MIRLPMVEDSFSTETGNLSYLLARRMSRSTLPQGALMIHGARCEMCWRHMAGCPVQDESKDTLCGCSIGSHCCCPSVINYLLVLPDSSMWFRNVYCGCTCLVALLYQTNQDIPLRMHCYIRLATPTTCNQYLIRRRPRHIAQTYCMPCFKLEHRQVKA